MILFHMYIIMIQSDVNMIAWSDASSVSREMLCTNGSTSQFD